MNKLKLINIYQNIFPWRNLNDFVTTIKASIVYTSNDNSLIAIHKPFGVGTYNANDLNVKKQNQDKIYYKLNGSPKYCLQDVLEPLTDEFESEKPYKIVKGIDRYMSGIVLLSNNHDHARKSFLRSISSSRCANEPSYKFRALTCGFPIVAKDHIKEKVGCELIEVDELGDHKEPKIVDKVTNRFHRQHVKDTNLFQVEMMVRKINREISVALIELNCSKTKWDFPRCYISSKAAFVLGDVRFSKRVHEVLGSKIKLANLKASFANDNAEPLSDVLKKRLGVNNNSQIPLMLDQYGLRLKNFFSTRPKGERDLVIESTYWPLHMKATADVLLGDQDNKNT